MTKIGFGFGSKNSIKILYPLVSFSVGTVYSPQSYVHSAIL